MPISDWSCPATKLGTLGGDSFVAVVEPAQHLLSAHHPDEPHLPRTFGRLLLKRLMRPRRVVVRDVLEQDPAEVALAQRDDVVRAVAAQRPDQALCDPVCLRRPNRRQDGLDADRARLRDEVTP